MRIGLVIDRIRLDEKLIIKAAEKLGVEVEIMDVSKVFFNITSLDIKPFNDVDIFLQRCVSTLKGLYITKILEEYGFDVVNSYNTSSNCIDKVKSSILFAKNNIPTPETILAFAEEGGLEALKHIGFPAILKPIMGSWARLVAKINDFDAAKSIFEDRKEMGVWYSIFYLQRYINKPGRDIRSMVIGDKVVAAIYRVNQNDWRTNTARGGTAVSCKVTPSLEELSLKAAEAVGGGILGVDLMEDGDHLVVHEANHSPEFKNIQRVTGKDIALEIVRYLCDVVRR